MRKGIVVFVLVVGLCGTAEAGMGTMLKNVWSYVAGFVTCGIDRVGALVDWAVASGTCAIQKVNKNPVTLQPLVPLLPTDPVQ